MGLVTTVCQGSKQNENENPKQIFNRFGLNENDEKQDQFTINL